MPVVAKNRRSRRARRLHPAPRGEPRPAGPSESPEQLSQRLDNLRGEIAAAKADAERRTVAGSDAVQETGAGGAVAVATEQPELKPPYQRPETAARGRRRFVAVGSLLGLAAVGVVVGLLVTNSKGSNNNSTSSTNAVSAYLKHNVPAGTAVGVIGGTQGMLPSGYQPAPVATPSSAGAFHYLLAPDPLTKAGPSLTTFIEKNASLLAVSPGHATLWSVNVQPGPTPPTTAAAPKTTPSTTVPATTAPTTAPPTTAAPTTAPPTTAPPTTAPPATTPPTSAPPATTPSPTAPPASVPATQPPAPTTNTVTVHMGESFWTIAQSIVQQRIGTAPTNAQIAQYWTQLIDANAHSLPHPGDPDLIYVGQTLVVPSG
jgi:hypothetical protein